MSPGKLCLEIVTPDGTALKESLVESVVFRRREKQFEMGSEIAIFPLHGPTLIRVPVAPARYRQAGETRHLAVGGGFVEVKKDHVLLVTPRVERVSAKEPEPSAKAAQICRKWRKEISGFQREMVGYLG